GMGLRIVTEELQFNGYILTNTMRDLQKVFASFVNSTSMALDFQRLLGHPLAGRIVATANGQSLLSWGASDGEQGVVYILQDGNIAPGTVPAGTVTASGPPRARVIAVEVWPPAAGTTGPLSTIAGLSAADGRLTVSLPAFSPDLVLKFKARPV